MARGHVFISYSHMDRELGREINHTLKELGYRTWFDEEHLEKDQPDYASIIDRALRDASVMVACISSSVMDDEGFVHVEHLRMTQFSERGIEIPVIMLLLEKCTIPTDLNVHPVIDWQGDNAREVISLMLAHTPRVSRSLGARIRDWRLRRRTTNPRDGLCLLGNPMSLPELGAMSEHEGEIAVQFDNVSVDFLGKQTTTWRAIYPTIPTRKQVSDDLLNEHPFGLMSDPERVAALSVWITEAMERNVPGFLDMKEFLIETLGGDMVGEFIKCSGKTALDALRTEGPVQEKILGIDGNVITALAWFVHPVGQPDFETRTGDEYRDAVAQLMKKLARARRNLGGTITTVLLLDVFISDPDHAKKGIEIALSVPLPNGDRGDDVTVSEDHRQPVERGNGDRSQGIALLSETEWDIEDVMRDHVEKIILLSPMSRDFCYTNLADATIEILARAARRFLSCMTDASAKHWTMQSITPELPARARAACMLHVLPTPQSGAQAWYEKHHGGYLRYMIDCTRLLKSDLKTRDCGTYVFICCGPVAPGLTWVNMTIYPVGKGPDLPALALAGDLLTDEEIEDLQRNMS